MLGRIFCAIYLRQSATGREHIPEGGFILAPNHASLLDPFLAGQMLRRPLYYVARRSLFKGWGVGWYLRQLHCVPVDRGRMSRETYREVVALLESGEGVLIFPEGTRSPDGKLGRLRSGVVHLARLADVPVVPALLVGSHRALGRGKWFPRPVKTTVYYGEPFRFPPEMKRDECLRLLEQRLLSLAERDAKVRDLAPAG